jgi:hypothetical protein
MREAPPPPIVPEKRRVVLKGRAVLVDELRRRFPILHRFVEETSFEDGDTVFPTQEEGCRYVFRNAPEGIRAAVEALNADIHHFDAEFPRGSPDRIAAFKALGSVIGSADYAELRLSQVDPRRIEDNL